MPLATSKKMKYRLLLILLSALLISCGNSDFDKYPPLTWSSNKVDSVLGCFGNSTGEEINDFSDRNGVRFRCLFKGTDYRKIIKLDSIYGLTDSIQAFNYKIKMCNLIHETKASLIFSNEDMGDLTILKYKDGTELYHIKDTSSNSLLGNTYWKNSFKKNLGNSVFFESSWYVNKNGTMLNLPD